MSFLNFSEIQNLKHNKLFMRELIIAIGLFLFIEGILYALFPSRMKNMLLKLRELNNNQLRSGGIAFVIIGFIIVWYFKR